MEVTCATSKQKSIKAMVLSNFLSYLSVRDQPSPEMNRPTKLGPGVKNKCS